MRITRRTLLIGAGSGVLGVLLASCTPEPAPTPAPSPSTPSAKPTPTGAGPAPVSVARSTWSTDPFARGAASVTPVGTQPSAREALSEPIEGRLFLAGEATDAERPGTTGAALRSGIRAAEELLDAAGPGERIAVVGAGLAGAAAVSRLSGADLEVIVFEARDRIGGRVQSLVDENTWPFPAQLGAWLVGEEDAELSEQLNALDIRSASISTPTWRSAEGDVEPVPDQLIADAVAAAQLLPADIPLEQALADAGADPEEPGLAALLAAVAAATGAEAEDASSWFPPALPSAAHTAPLADLTAVLDAMLDGVRVSLSSPVSRVAYDDAGVSLRIATGESLSFDRVIVTVPLGVLKSDGIEFSPRLPFGHRGAIAALEMGRIETIWLRFEDPLIETDAAIWHVVGGDAMIRTWFNLAPATGESILVGIVGGAPAGEFAELDDAAALTAALESLAQFTGAGA